MQKFHIHIWRNLGLFYRQLVACNSAMSVGAQLSATVQTQSFPFRRKQKRIPFLTLDSSSAALKTLEPRSVYSGSLLRSSATTVKFPFFHETFWETFCGGERVATIWNSGTGSGLCFPTWQLS